MLEQYISKLEKSIFELDGYRVYSINGVIQPEYLYRFPKGIWLSFEVDEKDNYFDVKLGRLFLFDDIAPRMVVLERLEYYFKGVNELKLGDIHSFFLHSTFDIKSTFELLEKNLKIIIENYEELIKNKNVKRSIENEEERLKSYLIQDLSNVDDLEKELQDKVNNFKGKINKKDSTKIIKKSTKKYKVYDQLFDGLVELLIGMIVIALAVLLSYLFSLKKDISNIPFEVFLIFGFVFFIVLVFIISLTVYFIKKRRKSKKEESFKD